MPSLNARVINGCLERYSSELGYISWFGYFSKLNSINIFSLRNVNNNISHGTEQNFDIIFDFQILLLQKNSIKYSN